VSVAKDDLDTGGVAVLTFDGGSAKQLGTGGFTCWLPFGRLIKAQALWYGSKWRTNNETELTTLHRGLKWIKENKEAYQWGD